MAFICSTSTPALAVNGTDTKHSFDGSSVSSDAVLRMEFGWGAVGGALVGGGFGAAAVSVWDIINDT